MNIRCGDNMNPTESMAFLRYSIWSATLMDVSFGAHLSHSFGILSTVFFVKMLPLRTCILAALPAVSALYYEDGTGRLPAMGWNSWNAYHCDVDADKIMEAATTMANKGFKAAGYNYINCDDCWSNLTGRDTVTHQLMPNLTKFPEGMNGLADRLHGMGFKAGIYSTAGTLTCGGYPASLGYEAIDAKTFADWGIDYLKYDKCVLHKRQTFKVSSLIHHDSCNVPSWWDDTCYACIGDPTFATNLENGTCTDATVQTGASLLMPVCSPEWPVDGRNYSQTYTAIRFRIMQEALLAQNRSILYSLCEWGMCSRSFTYNPYC